MKHYPRVPFFLLCCLCNVHAKKILCLGVQQVSHLRELHAIGEQLILNGHEVYTALQSNFPESKREDFRQQGIHILDFSVPPEEPSFAQFGPDMFKPVFKPNYKFPTMERKFSRITFGHCTRMMDDKQFIERVKDLKFDLVLVDGFFIAPCMFILPYHLNIPYVYEFSAVPWFMLRIPGLPSFQPFSHGTVDHKMSLVERLQNAHTFFSLAVFGFPTIEDDLLAVYAPDKTWEDLIRQSQLFIFTIDHVMERPMVSMPNVVMVPGLTVRPGQSLDKEFEDIMNEAIHGAIIVSFGAMAGSLPNDVIQKMISAFSQIEQTVIWRQSITITGLDIPENIHLKAWLPQQDLLAHKKTRLFITHCGNNGRHEAAYHAVPMLAIPLFADQHHNAFMVEKMGIGLQLNIHTFTPQEMVDKINQLLSNKTFSHQIKRRSAIIRDRPMSPRETAAYWVEHVMKYGGEHLRSHAMDMPGYAYYMFDVLVTVLVMFAIVVFALVFVAKKIVLMFAVKHKTKNE